jgi:hypothetical protein
MFTVRRLVDEYRMGDQVFLYIGKKDLYFFVADGKRIRQNDPQFDACISLAGSIS